MKLRRAVLLAWLIGALLPVAAEAQIVIDLPGAYGPPGESGPSSLFWVRGEYLLWWLKDQAVPPLVTTSATQSSLGRLGFADTSVLYGGNVDGNVRQGFRISAGAAPWLIMDDGARLGFEGSFFMLEHNNNGFVDSSNGFPVLARPFVDAQTGQQRVQQIANVLLTSPAGTVLSRAVGGTVSVLNPSDMLGAELNAALIAGDGEMIQVCFLGGVRYLYLQERLDIHADVQQASDVAAGITPAAFAVTDSFRTRNEFLGGQLGMRATARLDDFSLEVQGKVALGSTRQSVEIDGGTTAVVAGAAPVSGVGGLLTSPTNIGLYTRDRITVVPEVSVNVSYQFTDYLRGFIGYNFLYWSSVARPGPQVDPVVNTTFLPGAAAATGPARPAFPGVGTDLWVQGLTFGAEVSY